MTGPSHRADPADKPTRAEKREYYRTITARAAARNGMGEAEYKKYASRVGTRPHPLHKPAGLLGISIIMTLMTGAILVVAAIEWSVNRVNILSSFWLIVVFLVELCIWSWFLVAHEYRTFRNRRRDSVTLMDQGHSSFDD